MNNYINGGYSDVQITTGTQTFTGNKTFANNVLISGTLGVTGAITGALTGNASTATALATARAINGTNFDGTAAITVPVNNTDDTTTNATMYLLWTATAGGNYSAKVSTTKLSFNPSTGVLSSTFSGNITGNVTGNTSGSSGSCTGNSVTATTTTNITGGLLGSLPYQSAVDTTALLAGNITTTKKVVKQTGNGSVSAAPIWEQASVAECSDYETGTWTPTITAATVGDLSVTYNTNSGRYLKNGNQVTVSFTINTSAFTHTTAAGGIRIAGLPFAAASNSIIATANFAYSGYTKVGAYQLALEVEPNASYIHMIGCATAVSIVEITITDFPTAGSVILYGSITYFI